MDYKWHYDKLISTRKERVRIPDSYYELHHIIPKSMGGNNEPENLVFLTAREHFLAHWLLWKIHKSKETAFAFHAMKINKPTKEYSFMNSRQYAAAREASAFATSQMHKEGKYAYSEERKQKLLENPSGLWGKESQSKSSKARWKKYSKEERSKMQSEANLKGWANITEDKKQERIEKMLQTRKERDANRIGALKGWAKLTEEQRKERGRKISEARRRNKSVLE